MEKVTENLSGFKIWESPKEELDRKSVEQSNSEVGEMKIELDCSFDSCGEKRCPKIPYVKMTKLPRCWTANNFEILKKTPENFKISMEIPKAPLKLHNKNEKKFDGIPKRLQYPETEEENDESKDFAFGLNKCNNKHLDSTRAKQQCKVKKETEKKKEAKNYNEKPRSKNKKNNDKENNVNAAKETHQRQTTNRKVLSTLTPNLENSKKDKVEVAPKEKKPPKRKLSTCQSADGKDHLQWLQSRRDVGVWVECCNKKCRKWRYVDNYRDPVDVPKVWFCEMNNDKRFASCAIPEQETPPEEEEDFIMNAYNAGSIVWARLNGYPWWPAMVDDCPTFLRYYETHGKSKVPQKYHVIFFNEKIETAWLPVKDIKPYAENPRDSFVKKTTFRRKNFSKQLDVACELANVALSHTIPERLKIFSFVSRISGDKTKALKRKRQASDDEYIRIKSRRINPDADFVGNRGQSIKSLDLKDSSTNDKAKVPQVNQTPSSTSTNKSLPQNRSLKQKDSVNRPKSQKTQIQRKEIECITIKESEKQFCDPQNKKFLTATEINSRTAPTSVSNTIDKKSNIVHSGLHYSFLPKPLTNYEHLLIMKILDLLEELKKLREREEMPMEIDSDSDSQNSFSSAKLISHFDNLNCFNNFEATREKRILNEESFPTENRESNSDNNRNSVIVYAKPPSQSFKQIHSDSEDDLSVKKEVAVITID